MLSAPRIALALAALAIMPASEAFAAAAVGVNAVIRNSVQMKTETDAALRPAVVREQVHIGDAVVSGPQSSLQMLLLDKSAFTIGANASITIDRFVYDPNQGTSDIAASVAKGAFRFMSGRLTQGAGQSAIRTPVATIGVRGTIVDGLYGSDVAQLLNGMPGIPAFTGNTDNALFVVLSGPGADNQGLNRPGAIDLDVNGTMTALENSGYALLLWGAGQPVFGPFQVSDEIYARLSALLAAAPPAGQGNDPFGAASIGPGDIGPSNFAPGNILSGANDNNDDAPPPSGDLPFFQLQQFLDDRGGVQGPGNQTPGGPVAGGGGGGGN